MIKPHPRENLGNSQIFERKFSLWGNGDHVLSNVGGSPQRSCVFDLDVIPGPREGVEFSSPSFRRVRDTSAREGHFPGRHTSSTFPPWLSYLERGVSQNMIFGRERYPGGTLSGIGNVLDPPPVVVVPGRGVKFSYLDDSCLEIGTYLDFRAWR